MKEEGMYDHGRYPVDITYTSNIYSAETDGKGNPIPFFINTRAEGVIRVALEDDPSTFVDMHFNAGTGTEKVVAVDDRGSLSANLVAEYPYKPATTTINTTE